MKKTMISCAAASVLAVAGGAADAGVRHHDDPSIFSPFDNAQVRVYWQSSDAGYTGQLQWIDGDSESGPQTMWTNRAAVSGQVYELPRLFGAGERVDFRYEIVSGKLDAFSTADVGDWAQFSVDASDPTDVLVGIEDIRFPGGDMDHNDAVFRVVFSQAAVPAPGAAALLGLGGLMLSGRSRRQ